MSNTPKRYNTTQHKQLCPNTYDPSEKKKTRAQRTRNLTDTKKRHQPRLDTQVGTTGCQAPSPQDSRTRAQSRRYPQHVRHPSKNRGCQAPDPKKSSVHLRGVNEQRVTVDEAPTAADLRDKTESQPHHNLAVCKTGKWLERLAQKHGRHWRRDGRGKDRTHPGRDSNKQQG